MVPIKAMVTATQSRREATSARASPPLRGANMPIQ